jgi:hypothetical protein
MGKEVSDPMHKDGKTDFERAAFSFRNVMFVFSNVNPSDSVVRVTDIDLYSVSRMILVMLKLFIS